MVVSNTKDKGDLFRDIAFCHRHISEVISKNFTFMFMCSNICNTPNAVRGSPEIDPRFYYSASITGDCVQVYYVRVYDQKKKEKAIANLELQVINDTGTVIYMTFFNIIASYNILFFVDTTSRTTALFHMTLLNFIRDIYGHMVHKCGTLFK